ncbi:peptidoglycan-binding protein [Massilia antarctica]|uniref:Peptidoglycan-binding protein n=1 Tax=Massilia antarctica TaxID=2765360 RepID=A0AA48WCU0_9BURK|nr:peptidoglycan-binding protein [Massilia antarctica]QPI50018.1 peptidoglycan-binding protein [Massilia antarctica]
MTFHFDHQCSDHVRDVQRKLASLSVRDGAYYQGAIDGQYGPVTRSAVEKFQAANHDEEYAELLVTGEMNLATWQEINRQAGTYFTEAWQFEFEGCRGAVPDSVRPADRDALIASVHQANMAGLAFSGGGIRSATFNLGILQALAEMRMLRDFDYLSTVSGGGYIGSWFSKWLHREGGDITRLEQALMPGTPDKPVDREPGEIGFLRQYSNYLTPKTGLFSADTWSVLTTYARNTLLNLAILVSLLAASMVVPRLLVWLVNDQFGGGTLANLPSMPANQWNIWSIVAVGAAAFAVFCIAISISTKPNPRRTGWLRGQSQASILLFIVLPLLVAAFAGGCALWNSRADIALRWGQLLNPDADGSAFLAWFYLPGLCYFAAWAVGWLVAQGFNLQLEADLGRERAARDLQRTEAGTAAPQHVRRENDSPAPALLGEVIGHLLCAVAAFAVGALIVILGVAHLADIYPLEKVPRGVGIVQVVSFGLPAILCIFGITMVLSVGLVGRMYADRSREWWSRQGAWTSIMVCAWLALVAVSLYAPAVIAYGRHGAQEWFAALSLSWVATTVGGLLLGHSSASGKGASRPYLESVAALAPFVFSVGALCLVSALLHAALFDAVAFPVRPEKLSLSKAFELYNAQTRLAKLPKLLIALATLLSVGLLLTRRVDINKFSLHMMYRNRLVRTYLGASNAKRLPHPFTNFDDHDDVRMDELLKANGGMQRPYLIVNTALNLVNGAELAWQTRKAAGFSFTPAFCGFELPGMSQPGTNNPRAEASRGAYRRTSDYRASNGSLHKEESGIRLGMAMAVSGAAASPSMGYHSSPALSFLMTLFNVRLGRWFENPRTRIPNRSSTSPLMGLFPLLSELFGLTNADSNHVYLSDGGHFENLGIYELVRRRCRLIVAVDAGADGGLNFEDLGNALRKCATDLHVEIDIGVGDIDLEPDFRFSRAHCVKGTIRYDKSDQGGTEGTLLYIKPSLIGTEAADVLNYRKTNKSFPHQSTTDQWFDENQFESYRSLGYRIGMLALRDAAGAAQLPLNPQAPQGPGHDILRLCQALGNKWGSKRIVERRTATVHPLIVPVERRQGERRS